jgi:hypothetical protein
MTMIIKRLLAVTAMAGILVASQASYAAAFPIPVPSASKSTSLSPAPRLSAHPGLTKLRADTKKFRNLDTAKGKGYALLVDEAGLACIAEPGMGAMGVHYVNGTLVGDGAINPAKPEAMVYRRGAHGVLRLAAVEYVVIKSAWKAKHTSRPKLFGQKFNFTKAPNRFDLPPYYSLHVWVWKHNPAGMFEMWNPNVHCTF